MTSWGGMIKRLKERGLPCWPGHKCIPAFAHETCPAGLILITSQPSCERCAHCPGGAIAQPIWGISDHCINARVWQGFEVIYRVCIDDCGAQKLPPISHGFRWLVGRGAALLARLSSACPSSQRQQIRSYLNASRGSSIPDLTGCSFRLSHV